MAHNYWLMKSEPETFALEDLRRAPNQTTCWDGVRNYQARNFMRDDMRTGDRVIFYHSGKQPAAVGTAEIARAGYPDHTAWDQDSSHPDPRSTPENPVWYMVDVRFTSAFTVPVTLQSLRATPSLSQMLLLRRGNRLSVMPISKHEFDTIVQLGRKI